MRISDRYLAAAVGMGCIAAAALLVPLFGCFDLIVQLDDIGEDGYGFWQALTVTALLMPRRAVELGPFIALLGGIAGLGQLAVNGELTALRAAGLTTLRIGAPVVATGVALALALALADQFAVSPLHQEALQRRTQALARTPDELRGSVLWVRDGGQLLRVGELRAGRIPNDIEVLRFDAAGRLAEYIHADRAEIRRDGWWRLHGVARKRWGAGGQTAEQLAELPWRAIVSARRLDELALPAASLSPGQLYRYAQDLRATGQPAGVYAVALWQKLGAPLLTAALMLLAVSFASSHRRGLALGGRLALGALAGLGVYLLNQAIGAAAVLFALSPPLAGILPAALLGVAAWAWVARRDRGSA